MNTASRIVEVTDETQVNTVAIDQQAKYLNREVTWLEFNRRVLHQAVDERTPLLERVRFLSIYTSNLDEFFMKRVGRLLRHVATGVEQRSLDGLNAIQQLDVIRQMVNELNIAQAHTWDDMIRPSLREQGIQLVNWSELDSDERDAANRYFREQLFPVLTPLAVDPGHPFPFMSNLSTSLGVLLTHPNRDERLFARVKVPARFQRWVRLSDKSGGEGGTPVIRFVSVQDLVTHNMSALFPGMEIRDVMPFRVTRNADIETDDDDDNADLMEQMKAELHQRRFGRVVRLEHGPNPNEWMLRFLISELNLSDRDIYELPSELDYTALNAIADLKIPEHRYSSWVPTVPGVLGDEDADIFAVLRNQDLLVHHPYESFGASVERFIEAAVNDPHVLAIKMTLYRVGDDSPFIPLLMQAAEQGKQVVCLVELKARFDEHRNIAWAKALDKAGVHVVYGVIGLKTHTKTTLVVREEIGSLQCYAHIGTGNYHSQTANLYTDIGLMTSNAEITADLVEVFHFLTGRSLKRDYQKLLIAPVNMASRFVELIDREIECQSSGRPARIIAKMNSLEDEEICSALYRASSAGVKIDLIVRGFCCIRPGVPGLSENISVTSIIGRFLEHSRIFYFQNGEADPYRGEFYIGSADWMYRNLHARVEAITPIEDRMHREKLWELLQVMLNDRRQAWDMDASGGYQLRQPTTEDEEKSGTHDVLMRRSKSLEESL